jgi:hypothetical protein
MGISWQREHLLIFQGKLCCIESVTKSWLLCVFVCNVIRTRIPQCLRYGLTDCPDLETETKRLRQDSNGVLPDVNRGSAAVISFQTWRSSKWWHLKCSSYRQTTHFMSVVTINRLMLHGKIMAVYCERHMTLMSAVCGQNAWICNATRVTNTQIDHRVSTRRMPPAIRSTVFRLPVSYAKYRLTYT